MTKIVCVGRNYAEHAKELGNEIPQTPILFIKPASSIRPREQGITWHKALGECHFETEISIRIGNTISNADLQTAKKAIEAVTLGLDLTLRDVQNILKAKGHPWERAKAFDGAAIFGDWLPVEIIEDFDDISFDLKVNGQIRQQGNSSQMLFGIVELISHISESFTLNVGDVVMTGTPAGVGALLSGDELEMCLETQMGVIGWKVEVL